MWPGVNHAVKMEDNKQAGLQYQILENNLKVKISGK
jgi:hypothetical protein